MRDADESMKNFRESYAFSAAKRDGFQGKGQRPISQSQILQFRHK
jgi:hypothetical protein